MEDRSEYYNNMKPGDILYNKSPGGVPIIYIFKRLFKCDGDMYSSSFCAYRINDDEMLGMDYNQDDFIFARYSRYATDDEKKLFNIKLDEAGYHYDSKLNKLIRNSPWFKIGDWIINKQHNTVQVVAVIKDSKEYRLISTDGIITLDYTTVEQSFKPWKLRLTNPGNVLCYPNGGKLLWISKGNKDACMGYIGYNSNYPDNGIYLGTHFSGNFHNKQDIRPATQEERIIFFKKIYEAGYKWNQEKLRIENLNEHDVDKKLIYKSAIESLLYYKNKLLNETDSEESRMRIKEAFGTADKVLREKL